MQENIALAIKTALEENKDKFVEKSSNVNADLKRPDLFSLSNDTELFQNEKGITIKIDRSKDSNLTDFGKATLNDRYLSENESYQDLFARVAATYADDNLHAQRLYNYISKLWFIISW